MAVFMLAYALEGSELPNGVEERLGSLVSQAGRASTWIASGMVVVAAELQLWPTSGILESQTSVVVVAGDPVLCVDDVGVGRVASIARLGSKLLAGDREVLAHCEGTYCALVVDLTRPRATVVADKLGVRPVYVGRHQGVVYVATALWMLEQLADLPKRCDWRALAEVAAFGYPLADRTPYEGIYSLPGGTVLECEVGHVLSHAYWSWRHPMMSPAAEPDSQLQSVESAFQRAVDDRLFGDRECLAFLSGGMDSRYIASRLRQQGVELHTLNFAPEGSADLSFGRLAAQAMGTRHMEFGAGDAPFAQRKSDAIASWRRQRAQEGHLEAANTRVLWSGDGGSVVLGHVYLNDEIVRCAREQGLDMAARVIQRHNKYELSQHMFTSRHRALAAVPLQGIRDELRRCAAHEPGRACHLFFVLNDQRRHLVEHFEHVHELGFDLHLPFFDGRLIQSIIDCPVELLVNHRLYNRLFERLPFGLGQVPWQAYPGHEPCPVKHDESLRRQWSDGWFDAATERQKRLDTVDAVRAQLHSPAFPAQVLSQPRLSVALQLTRLGWRDYSYLATGIQPFLKASQLVASHA